MGFYGCFYVMEKRFCLSQNTEIIVSYLLIYFYLVMLVKLIVFEKNCYAKYFV